MTDPQRPVIMYEELMENITEDGDGWVINIDGAPVLFVHKKTGHEILHGAVSEFVRRYNGAPIAPHMRQGFRV